MYWALEVSLWLTVPLAVLSGALLVRIFIIFHDCTHGSYFRSRRANDIVGFIAGALTFSPYQHWRWEHAIHHGSSGNLDRRGTGDVWTMTVQEYLSASRQRRLLYRLARNPLILFVLAPLFVFVIKQRFASANAQRRQRHSVWWLNVTLLISTPLLSSIFGLVRLPAHSINRDDRGRRDGPVAILCPASVPRRLLGTRRQVGLHGSRAARQFVLQAAEGAAMDLREHRLSSYPPSQPAHSQLQLAEVPRKRPAIRRGHVAVAAVEPAIAQVPLLG